MAGGAYKVNTQEALAAWSTAEEESIFTAKLDGTEYFITSHRDPVPEPSTVFLFGAGLIGLIGGGAGKSFLRNNHFNFF